MVGYKRVLAGIEKERRVTCAGLPGVVVGELHCWEKGIPIILVDVDEGTEHIFQGPIGSFRLSVGLWVVGRRHGKAGTQELKKGAPELPSETRVPI